MDINPEQLIRDLNSEDELGLLLRGHLYIENELVKIIEAHLPHPKKFDIAAINFPKKIYLAAAMGILSEAEIEPYLFFNKLRNKLAHNLGEEITESDIRGLIESLTPRQLQMLQFAIDSRPEREHGLQDCILILFLYLFSMLKHLKGLSFDELTEWKRLYPEAGLEKQGEKL